MGDHKQNVERMGIIYRDNVHHKFPTVVNQPVNTWDECQDSEAYVLFEGIKVWPAKRSQARCSSGEGIAVVIATPTRIVSWLVGEGNIDCR